MVSLKVGSLKGPPGTPGTPPPLALMGTTGWTTVSSSLLAGATTTVTVNFANTLPDTDYAPMAFVSGGTSLLGNVQINYPATTKTVSSCTLQIKNVGLTAIASSALTIQVVAVRLI